MSNYPLRLPDHVMADVKALAAKSGTSLNQFIASLIAEHVGQMKAVTQMEHRAARARPDAALAILRRAPDVPPAKGDEIRSR